MEKAFPYIFKAQSLLFPLRTTLAERKFRVRTEKQPNRDGPSQMASSGRSNAGPGFDIGSEPSERAFRRPDFRAVRTSHVSGAVPGHRRAEIRKRQ